jgi:hypothetical protein
VSYAGLLQEFPGDTRKFEADNLLAWEVTSIPPDCQVFPNGVVSGGGVPFAHDVFLLVFPRQLVHFTPIASSPCPDVLISLVDASTGKIIWYADSKTATVGS